MFIVPLCRFPLVWRTVLAAVTLLALATGQAFAKRVALVVGNSAYRYVPELANPRNDAQAVTAALAALGFEVVGGFDLDRSALEGKVREFSQATRGAELALFYYAGHGLQVAGQNYLVPVDAELADEADLDFQTVSMDAVMRTMERERRTNLIILDACRNNPLAKNLARSMGTRSANVGRGLAPLETGVGTLISFATQPGNVALDGDGANSPFTTALLRHIDTPDLDVALMMRRVRRDVMDATAGQQVPWSNSSLTDAVFLSSGGAGTAAPPAVSSQAPDLVAWTAIRDSNSPAVLEAFVKRFPDSLYADFAKARLAEIGRQEAALGNSSLNSDLQSGLAETLGESLRTVLAENCHETGSGGAICATSALKSQGSNSYQVGNLADGDRSTAWVEGVDGDGVGQSVVLVFGGPRPVGYLEIVNGYAKNADIFRKNGRVRDIEIRADKNKKRVRLDDTDRVQRIDISDLGDASAVEVKIMSVYPGSKYDDTAISELRVYN